MIRNTVFFICSVLLMCAILYILVSVPIHGTRAYDCRLAEISPDYPLTVKQECRKLNAENIKGLGNTGKPQ
jgi:hypothetical protein